MSLGYAFSRSMMRCLRPRRSMLAVVEELLARDLVVLNGIHADLFDGLALSGGFPRDVEGEVDGELVGAVEEGAADFFAVDLVVASPNLGLVDDRLLAGGFPPVAFDGHDVGRVHGA